MEIDTEGVEDAVKIGNRKRVHPRTFRSWITRGVEVNGKRIKLEALRVGGKWKTTEAAVAEFIAATQPQPTGEAAIQTPAQLARRAESARSELRKRGVKC